MGGTAGGTTMARAWRRRSSLDRRVRAAAGDHFLVGKRPKDARQLVVVLASAAS
jgi:surfactin synthase thioesterase subunit